MLSVVCWRWGDRYDVSWVNLLHSMISRHLKLPHEFFCISDTSEGINPGIEYVPMWDPEGLGRCRRLRIFDPKMEAIFGKRLVQLDIDCVVTGDITPLLDRPDPFVIWRSVPAQRYVYGVNKIKENPESGIGAFNTSLVLMNTGVFPSLWKDYQENRYDLEWKAKKKGFWTSLYNRYMDPPIRRLDSGDDDQAIISLYAHEIKPPIWLEQDGIYKWGRRGFEDRSKLPANARLVFFNGSLKGNTLGLEDYEWIKEHRR